MKFICAFLFLFNIIFTFSFDVDDEKCARACTDDNNPVCGDNGMAQLLFPNRCVMEFENCKLQLHSAPRKLYLLNKKMILNKLF